LAALARRYFGTDGVRGVVGQDLTTELVQKLGKASTLWSKGGRVFVGRDTRGSGPELEEAFARGVVEAGGNAVSGGVLPTPAIAPKAFEQLGATVTAVASDPDGANINLGSGATDLSLLRRTVLQGDFDLGVAFDGDGDRMLAVDANGTPVDGDQILAILADHLDVDIVAVTQMTNFGFHRFAEERGIRLLTTEVGDRTGLEALR